jgi:hypothetical protein
MFAGSNTSVAQIDDSAQLVVRETVCKTILNRGSISDYTLNCYTGCSHGCVYCYARFMQRFHPHDEAWGKFVDVKINAVEVLKRQLRRLLPGDVFVSSACDGWQPVEAQYGLTRRCCELLLNSVQSKSPCRIPVSIARQCRNRRRAIVSNRSRFSMFLRRRARGSNPQPLTGHHISSVAANHSLTLRKKH